MTAPGRFLIVTWEGGGNVPPALALGAWLTLAGHDVRLLGPTKWAERAVSAGLRFVDYESVEPWPVGVSEDDDPARFDAIRNGMGVAHDFMAEVNRERPDVVVIDCMMGAVLAAAERLSLRTCALVHVLLQPFATSWGDAVVDALKCREALGLARLKQPGVAALLDRADLVLASIPRQFDFPGHTPANTHYVGPLLDPSPVRTSSDVAGPADAPHPLVLVSFSSTLQGQREALPPVLDAVGALPVRGLLTLGGVFSADAFSTPPNVSVRSYVPHTAVLPKTAAVIGHGGLSTIMVSLAHGVPMVCIPQGREQGPNAKRVADVGAGIALSRDATSREIAAAVWAVLKDVGYRVGAERMASVIAKCAGGPSAVGLLETLLPAPSPSRLPAGVR